MKLRFWRKSELIPKQNIQVALITKDSPYLTTKDLVRILKKHYRETD